MDIITIFSAILKYGLWALIAVIALALVYVVGYIVYRKVFHGTKSLSVKQGIVLILLAAWFVIVLGLTTFSRGANYTGSVNFSLFSGYISAWNQWSYSELQLIIFNMLMFAPLGFLLPFSCGKGRKFSFACMISFGVTFFIEILQLVTGRGIFEFDDLLHNFIGSILGYFVAMFFYDCISNKKIMVKPLLRMLAIPLIFAIGIFSTVLVYNSQEYGNWAFLPAEKQDMSDVTIECETDLASTTATVSIYKNQYANNFDYAKWISKQFADFAQVELRETIHSEGNNRIFETTAGGQITYFSREGFWSYINWNAPVSLTADTSHIYREKVETWLKENNMLPENAEFTLQNSTILRWDLDAAEIDDGSADYVSGLIMVQFDEQGQITNFDYHISNNVFVGIEEITSPQEAYRQILAGNFEQYTPFEAGDKLYITEYSTEYAYDTKGYCRPVYKFSGYINERNTSWECFIPAMD